MSKDVVTSDSSSIMAAVSNLKKGAKSVSITLHEKPPTINDINVLAHALVDFHCEMAKYELKFCADMCFVQSALSDKQRAYLKRLALKYLKIDIDAESVPASGPANGEGVAPAAVATTKGRKQRASDVALAA